MSAAFQNFDDLLREHRVLLAHYGEVQRRCDALLANQRARIEALEADAVRLRGNLIARTTALAFARSRKAVRALAAAAAPSTGLPRKSVLWIDRNADDGAALEASLRAADLVICQTGCISHDAYWRVQDHCKRTGKQCVMVDQTQPLRFVSRLEFEAPPTDAGGS